MGKRKLEKENRKKKTGRCPWKKQRDDSTSFAGEKQETCFFPAIFEVFS
jgi:hypothetical protein